jgi:hypothetical protein
MQKIRLFVITHSQHPPWNGGGHHRKADSGLILLDPWRGRAYGEDYFCDGMSPFRQHRILR